MPYRPSHRQLEYLVALGETGHFGEAASKCHVSQPTLSVQIALLEDRLGVNLIDRTPGNMTPTHVGKQVIFAAKTILHGLDEILALARTSQTNLGGLISLGVVPTFGPYFLPKLLPVLHETYRDLQVYIREDRPTTLELDVLTGEIDCALGPKPRSNDLLEFHEICNETIFLGVPVNHPLAHLDVVHASELRGQKLLTLGRGHKLFENVRELATLSGAVLAEDYEGTSLDALRQMVSIEMGLSLFPELYVLSEFRKEENVKLLTIEGWPARRTIGYFWRSNSARTQHFLELVALSRDTADDLLR
jgi:LysR family hydrogen peroxide-inducible transcriptional activator